MSRCVCSLIFQSVCGLQFILIWFIDTQCQSDILGIYIAITSVTVVMIDNTSTIAHYKNLL